MREETKNSIEDIKTFRKKLKEASEKSAGDSGKKQRDYAAEKQAERKPKYDDGWKNFSVVVPPQCVDFLKSALERYKAAHPHLWEKPGSSST